MYETATVLSVRTSTCLPNSGGRNGSKAKLTAHSSRQLMCQSIRGPVQSPEAACPLYVAPEPVLDASVVTTVWRDTCSRGTPARRKARSVQGLIERRHCWVIPTRSVPRHHAHLGTRECSQCCSGLIWSNPSGVTAAADAICPWKPLPHLGWRDWLDCILCQEDSNLLAQDRGVPDCHRRVENAVELGRSPGELNRVAESNCAREPARQAGRCELQRHNRRTSGGAAKGVGVDGTEGASSPNSLGPKRD